MKAAFNSIVPFRRRRPLKAAAGAALLVVVVLLGVQFVLAAPPEPSFTVSNATPLIGETVNFSSTTTDPDGDGEAGGVAWDFNYDGTTFDEDATGPTASTSYTSPGTRTVAMRVTDGTVNDDTAQTVIATNPVTVTNSLPNASFTVSPNPAQLGQTVNFNGAASDDPDPGGSITRSLRINAPPAAQIGAPSPAVPDPGEQISFSASGSSDSDGSISSYQWDFNYDGTFNAEASGQTTTHSYPTAGNKTIRLRVTDNDGAIGEVGLALRVNASPTSARPSTSAPPPPPTTKRSRRAALTGSSTETTTSMTRRDQPRAASSRPRELRPLDCASPTATAQAERLITKCG